MKLSKKITKSDKAEVRFCNWLAQIAGLTLTKFFYAILGRGSSKTTDFLTERLMEMVWDMPGAPVALVSDTYMNLKKNVLPTLIEGLEMKGWREGYHYVIEKEPPDTFEKPYNRIVSYKHTVVFFNGFNLTLISLDRPSAAAGRSYVHIIGDEVKFFPEHKIAKLTKAVRGYKVKYGNSPFYRGHTFTTDMPNINLIGEHDWILKQASKIDKEQLILILQTGFILNDIRKEYVEAMEKKDRVKVAQIEKKLARWEQRYKAIRKNSVFFWVASSFVNVDILTEEFFEDEIDTGLEDIKAAILSLVPKLEAGKKFYANLNSKHFYQDGADPYWSGKFGINDDEDCRILKYLDKEKSIDAGVDFGNMMSMVIGQEDPKYYNVLKNFYTIPPLWIRELADDFIKYFEPHKHKVLNLYYDRAGNSYKDVGQDQVSKLKKAIERDANGKKTGWKVVLMSVGQGTLGSNQEYLFMMDLLSENIKGVKPVRIDQFNCKELKSSMELTQTKVVETRKGTKMIVKKKSSEKLPTHRLPMESTNLSDGLKYLFMRKKWLKLSRIKVPTKILDAG